MPVYEVMTEAARDPNTGEFVPVLAWAYRGGERIGIEAVPGAEGLALDYQRRLEEARREGKGESDIWEYWRAQGGNGYFAIRTLPEGREANSMTQALAHALRRMAGG